MCLCAFCYTFLGFWNAMGVASGEFVSLLSSVQCSSSGLRVCASLSTSVSCCYVRAMPTLSVSVIVASETTDLSVWSLNHVVSSASMIGLCPRDSSQFCSILVPHAYLLLWLGIAFSLLCSLTVSESVSELSVQPTQSWF